MSRPVRVLIVDDEMPARMRLKNLLGDIAALVPTEVVGEAADGVEALQVLEEVVADVVFLDIRMPRMDGLELARHLTNRSSTPVIIFVTAYDQYAVQAFEVSAVDYLMKPVKAERLAEALRKSPRIPGAVARAVEAIEPGGRRQLRCLERGKVLLVPVADVLYFKAEQKYVVARTVTREYLLEESLTQLETEFATRFMRIHRNCLVARDAVTGYEREHVQGGDGETHWALTLTGISERLSVSRRLWSQVKANLNQA